MRYLYADLKNSLNHINAKLVAKGKGEHSIKAEPRSGYYGLDVYKGTRCIRTIRTASTPKELLADAYEWAFETLAD